MAFVVEPGLYVRPQALEGLPDTPENQTFKNGIVSPYEFIHLAEETGLIFGIGRFTLQEACRC
jgi:EAL domain-containing protein (putative c-di-GMP-specific phosphodiesterase class I)